MSDQEHVSKDREADAFWDLEKFVIPKSKSPVKPAARSEIELTDIVSEPLPAEASGTKTYRSSPVPPVPREESARSVSFEYTDNNPLIEWILITKGNKVFHFYDDFRKSALKYDQLSGSECEPVNYFSFLPQYAQFSKEQREWYLWWRECVRNGRFPDTAYSYVVLYVYELINISDTKVPEDTLTSLLNVWKAYRGRYPRLDSFMGDWILDFCLVYRLPIPDLSELFTKCEPGRSVAEVPELLFPKMDRGVLTDYLIGLYSTYQYKKSVYYTDSKDGQDLISYYDSIFPRAISYVLPVLVDEMKAQVSSVQIKHDAFPGALCVPEVKYTISLQYYPLQQIPLFRRMLTQLCRLIDNGIRELLFIRSKLTVKDLSQRIRSSVETFFSEEKIRLYRNEAYLSLVRDSKHVPASQGDGIEYEIKYSGKKTDLSPERAKQIEQESWQTTEKLIEAFEDEESAAPAVMPSAPEQASVQEPAVTGEDRDLRKALQDASLLDYLNTLKQGNYAAFRAMCTKNNLLPDSVMEQINQISLELLGDVILENSDDGRICLVEDYVSEWDKEGN